MMNNKTEWRTARNVVSTNNTKLTFSRTAILSWINNVLDSQIGKIEELCTGAAYCAMLNILFPDCVNEKRVKYNTRLEIHWIHNLTLLQHAMHRLHVDKPVPIQKLVKGKYHDNYEFAVWFRRFFDANMPMPVTAPLPGLLDRYATEPVIHTRYHRDPPRVDSKASIPIVSSDNSY